MHSMSIIELKGIMLINFTVSYDSDLGEGLCDLDIQTSTEEDEPKVLISPREIDSLPELVSSVSQ